MFVSFMFWFLDGAETSTYDTIELHPCTISSGCTTSVYQASTRRDRAHCERRRVEQGVPRQDAQVRQFPARVPANEWHRFRYVDSLSPWFRAIYDSWRVKLTYSVNCSLKSPSRTESHSRRALTSQPRPARYTMTTNITMIQRFSTPGVLTTYESIRMVRTSINTSPHLQNISHLVTVNMHGTSLFKLVLWYCWRLRAGPRHTSPGRFFAANEIKTMLAYTVLRYDMKFAVEGVRPKNQNVFLQTFPAPQVEVLFRDRQEIWHLRSWLPKVYDGFWNNCLHSWSLDRLQNWFSSTVLYLVRPMHKQARIGLWNWLRLSHTGRRSHQRTGWITMQAIQETQK